MATSLAMLTKFIDLRSLFWCGTTAFWSVAVLLAIYKCIDARVDSFLRYGRRQRVHKSDPTTKRLFVLRLIYSAVHPSNGLPSKASWISFYVIGAIAGLICRMAPFGNESLSFFTAHVTRRLLECIIVHRFSHSRISWAHWLMGTSFYIAVPITLLTSSSRASPSFLTVTIFAFASLVQYNAHCALVRAKPLVGKYGIPKGSGFGAVACPHYTAEIAIYVSLTSIAPGLPSLMMLAFVVINLAQSGIQNTNWYRETFGKLLPSGYMRYALIKHVF